MKKLVILLLFVCTSNISFAQKTKSKTIKNQEAELACGECKFKMEGKGCDLAVKIDGKTYYVDGRKIDDFGDAHADDGFCNAVKKAVVSGKIANNRFKEKSIQIIEEKKSTSN